MNTITRDTRFVVEDSDSSQDDASSSDASSSDEGEISLTGFKLPKALEGATIPNQERGENWLRLKGFPISFEHHATQMGLDVNVVKTLVQSLMFLWKKHIDTTSINQAKDEDKKKVKKQFLRLYPSLQIYSGLWAYRRLRSSAVRGLRQRSKSGSIGYLQTTDEAVLINEKIVNSAKQHPLLAYRREESDDETQWVSPTNTIGARSELQTMLKWAAQHYAIAYELWPKFDEEELAADATAYSGTVRKILGDFLPPRYRRELCEKKHCELVISDIKQWRGKIRPVILSTVEKVFKANGILNDHQVKLLKNSEEKGKNELFQELLGGPTLPLNCPLVKGEKGWFSTPIIAELLVSVFHGPKSVLKAIGKATNGTEWGLNSVTPGCLAWASVSVRMIFSADRAYRNIGDVTGHDWSFDYNEYIKIASRRWHEPAFMSIIDRINRRVFHGGMPPEALQGATKNTQDKAMASKAPPVKEQKQKRNASVLLPFPNTPSTSNTSQKKLAVKPLQNNISKIPPFDVKVLPQSKNQRNSKVILSEDEEASEKEPRERSFWDMISDDDGSPSNGPSQGLRVVAASEGSRQEVAADAPSLTVPVGVDDKNPIVEFLKNDPLPDDLFIQISSDEERPPPQKVQPNEVTSASNIHSQESVEVVPRPKPRRNKKVILSDDEEETSTTTLADATKETTKDAGSFWDQFSDTEAQGSKRSRLVSTSKMDSMPKVPAPLNENTKGKKKQQRVKEEEDDSKENRNPLKNQTITEAFSKQGNFITTSAHPPEAGPSKPNPSTATGKKRATNTRQDDEEVGAKTTKKRRTSKKMIEEEVKKSPIRYHDLKEMFERRKGKQGH